MKFDPKNVQPKPTGNFALLTPGVCNFYVLDAVDKTGQYGDYIELNLKLEDSNGTTSEVTTFLSVDERNLWKTQEFMIEIGQEDAFNTGNINATSLASPKNQGKCMLQHKEFLSKSDGEIKLSNHVASFAERKNIPSTWTLSPDAIAKARAKLQSQPQAQVASKTAGKTAKGFDDDVPF